MTLNLERICKDFGRIASDNVDPGGQSTLNLERIHKDLEGLPLTMFHRDLWEGQLTLNMERIRKDFGRIASDMINWGGVD